MLEGITDDRMKALVTRLRRDSTREKVLVTDWPVPEGPTGNEIMTKTICSGVTNGTERNDLMSGNYANRDEDLPKGWGYQNVGKVIEVGPDVSELQVGMHADYMMFSFISIQIKC